MFTGEDTESKNMRLRMTADMADPRKAFVWGVLVVSQKSDPAYLASHSTTAIRDWYGVQDAKQLLEFTPASFGTSSHAGYNHY